MSILEIGPATSGKTFAQAVTVDSVKRDGLIDHVATWGTDRLPFEDNTFRLVYASHVLEHVPWFRTGFALSEAFRVLKPNGVLQVWVPDFEIIVQGYLKRELPEDWTPLNDEREPMKWVAGRLFCGTRNEEESSWHRSVFDAAYLIRCFKSAGFAAVRRMVKQPSGQRVNHESINLGVRGYKPC